MSFCEKYRNLILTDDLDNEISPLELKELENHIQICEECKNLRNDAKKILFEPFQDLQKFHPPPIVWSNIVQELDIDDLSITADSNKNYININATNIFSKLKKIYIQFLPKFLHLISRISRISSIYSLHNIGSIILKVIILIITILTLYYYILKSLFVLPIIPKPMIETTSSSHFSKIQNNQTFEEYYNPTRSKP